MVVVGHCIPDATAPTGISSSYMRILHSVIYSFHMPLFFFISGYLISRRQIIAKGETITASLKKRFHRLLVPYLFVGLCYAPMKYLLSSFANRPYDFSQIWKIIIGINPDGELWFLYALFVITMVAGFTGYRISKLGLTILSLLAVTTPLLPIVTSNMLYVFLGIYARRDYPNFIVGLKMPVLLIASLAFAVVNICSILYGGNSIFRILTSITGIILCLRFSQWVDGKSGIFRNGLIQLGLFSMDIYILSDIIKIPFRIILWSKLHLYMLSFIVCFVLSVVLSYIFSKYFIRKSTWLSYLILGIRKGCILLCTPGCIVQEFRGIIV